MWYNGNEKPAQVMNFAKVDKTFRGYTLPEHGDNNTTSYDATNVWWHNNTRPHVNGFYEFVGRKSAECHYHWHWTFKKTGYTTVVWDGADPSTGHHYVVNGQDYSGWDLAYGSYTRYGGHDLGFGLGAGYISSGPGDYL